MVTINCRRLRLNVCPFAGVLWMTSQDMLSANIAHLYNYYPNARHYFQKPQKMTHLGIMFCLDTQYCTVI